jgi:hypothetical protein
MPELGAVDSSGVKFSGFNGLADVSASMAARAATDADKSV